MAAGTKVLQQNVARSITLPPAACIPPIVHPQDVKVNETLASLTQSVYSKANALLIPSAASAEMWTERGVL